MHLRILLISPILAVLAVPTTAAEREFPYKAYISAEDVYVRCGPGNNYYPTDKLKMGQEVDVYRHDPGGWYAIRPPKGSFSWASSRWLEIGPDGLASVSGDRVAARVGSRFSDIRDVIQVRLDRGEMVEVLEKGTAAAGQPAGTWCKIAPPAGEFRWVYGKYVDPDYPVDGVRKTDGDRSPLVQHSARAVQPPVAAAAADTERSGGRVAAATHDDEPPGAEQADYSSSPASTIWN